jgi:plasmid stability protein
MSDLLVRDVPPETLRRLRQRAAAQGRSLQQELLRILAEATVDGPEDALRLARRIRARLRRACGRHEDSADLLREDRAR